MLYHVHHAGLQLSNFNEVTLFCAFCSCYEIKVLKLFFFLQMLLYQLKFSIYRKIPYGERAFSKTFSWERWGGGAYIRRAYTWRNICVLKTLYFVHANVIF